MKAAFLLASLLSLAILSPGEGGVTTVTLPQQVPQARDPLPIVREDELLQKVFGSGHLERFFNTSFRQHQYRVRMEDMRTLTEVMGEEAFDLSYTKDPLALVSELFQLFNDRSTLKDALSLHDRAGASQGRPPADADIETLLDRGNSFVFRFEHLPKSSLPIQDALQEVLVTTVTPHIYASGKNALALQVSAVLVL